MPVQITVKGAEKLISAKGGGDMSGLTFFEKLDPKGDKIVPTVKYLLNLGYDFKLGFNSVEVIDPKGDKIVVSLAAPVHRILDGSADNMLATFSYTAVVNLLKTVMADIDATKLNQMLKSTGTITFDPDQPDPAKKKPAAPKVKVAYNDPPGPQPIPGAKPPSPDDVQMAFGVKQGVQHNVKKTVTTGDLADRVHLRDATEINQPVFGGGGGAMYRVVGVGMVKVAARLKGKQFSIRVEGDAFNPVIAAELKALGLETKEVDYKGKKKKYMSAHYDVSEVPAQRVLGAVLYAKGMNLSERIDSIEDLKNGA